MDDADAADEENEGAQLEGTKAESRMILTLDPELYEMQDFYLDDRALRKLIFICCLVQMGCEFEPGKDISDWNGTNEEFSFDQRNSEEINGTSLLVDKKSGMPFTGEVSRKKIPETHQTFKVVF